MVSQEAATRRNKAKIRSRSQIFEPQHRTSRKKCLSLHRLLIRWHIYELHLTTLFRDEREWFFCREVHKRYIKVLLSDKRKTLTD